MCPDAELVLSCLLLHFTFTCIVSSIKMRVNCSPAGSHFAGVFWGVWSFPFPRIQVMDAWLRAMTPFFLFPLPQFPLQVKKKKNMIHVNRFINYIIYNNAIFLRHAVERVDLFCLQRQLHLCLQISASPLNCMCLWLFPKDQWWSHWKFPCPH